MTGIEILQRQFEEAAKQYPGLRHTIVQRSKEGIDPKTTALEYIPGNIEPDADYYVYRWGEYIDREPNETGYPSWHFLSRPSPQVWNVRHAEGRALVLAEEAGKCLIALPELEGLTIDNSAERWFLALHRIHPCTKWAYDSPPSKFHPTIPRLKLSGSWREAEPGEAHIEELDNVFLKSAMLCGKLLEEPTETEQDTPVAKEEGEKAKTIGSINIRNFQGILGDVQAEKVQTGDYASIHKEAHTESKNKEKAKLPLIGWIFKKTWHLIVAIIVAIIGSFIAAILIRYFW